MANIQELSLEDQLFDARSRIQVLIANLESNERVHQHDVQELRARRDTSIAVLKAQLQAKDDALREKELEMKAMGKELRETKARDSEEMRVAEAKRRVDQDERRQLEEGRGKLDNDRRRLDEQKKTLDEARALLDARQRQFDETKETQRRLTRETEDRLKELTQQLELSKQNRALEMSTVDRAVQANEHAVKQETGLPLLATASAALTVVSSRVLFDSDDSKENLSSYQGHNITRGHSHIEAFGSQSRPVPHLRATVAHAPRNLSTAASVEVIELSSDEESMHDDPCPGAADPSSHGERSPRREVTPEGKGTVRGTMPPTPQTQPKAKLEQSALGSSSRDQLPGSGTPYLGSAPSINKAENLNKIFPGQRLKEKGGPVSATKF
ncbi:hypothetical protein OF83DRAFT_454381 [Amylostereum chailletii]|nr:hypothetical protein OF83DRAFT_454381 [Amylostereum chailletii]